jgi:hypothetical protein
MTLAPWTGWACGPFFPNSMLDRGDDALLAAPRANFFIDLERLPLPRSNYRAVKTDDFAAEAAEADSAELAAALAAKKTPREKSEEILRAFGRERAKLTAFRAKLEGCEPKGTDEWVDGQLLHKEPAPRPISEAFDAGSLGQAPAEFVDYLQGSFAWFNQQTNAARESWQALLHRPAEERHYRSTWAAYMLGKTWADEDPAKAAVYFQQVRTLRGAGFADRIGLAAASFGEEARLCLRQTNASGAIDLYLQQLATGDGSAESSLRFACQAAMTNGPETLARLAANPMERRVMSAYVIANKSRYDGESEEVERSKWLSAVEAAEVRDADCAEELALAAYQAGRWDMAQRWLNQSAETPTAKWLQTKLWLRAGKTKEAATLLDEVIELFPTNEIRSKTNNARTIGLEDALEMNGSTYTDGVVSVRAQAMAEAGVLRLSRQEYVESLDALLRAGFWLDAAYIAERVLTVEELKGYVDENWPAQPTLVKTNEPMWAPPFEQRMEVRYLLGRRLARQAEWDAARPYYPKEQLTNYDTMARDLKAAANTEVVGDEEIDALLEASSLMRQHGMELFGYEGEPDWAVWPDFEFDLTAKERAEAREKIAPASAEEIERAKQGLDSRRFHYRYDAAALAMEAAKLMPDNTEEKAIVLCTAGSWMKARDPKAADVYYKELVRHCRKTEIGALADRMGWFPTLDATGKPERWEPKTPVETNAPSGGGSNGGSDGYWYALNRGNTLQDVADAAAQAHGVALTAEEIQAANGNVNTNRLKAGMRIFAPMKTAKTEAEQQ